MNTKVTMTQFAIHREDENPIFGDNVTRVSLEDEGGGPFLVLSQVDYNGTNKIRVDFSELDVILKTAKELWEFEQ